MITEHGFGSKAAIRRGDRHHRGSLAGFGWVAGGVSRTQRGKGEAVADTGEVSTVDLEMRLGVE